MGKTTVGQFILVCIFFSASFSAVRPQSAYPNESYYRWFDARVGPANTGLYEGILFREQFRTINERTPYYINRDFHDGSLVYNGQPFFGLNLKYHVFNDALLLKVADRLGGNTLQLFKDKVSEFTIEGHRFINLGNTMAERGISGFYEVSMDSESFRLFTKHRLKQFNRKDRSSLYYEFLPGKKEHLLFYGGSYYTIDNRRDLIAIFPELDKQITAFYNRARDQRRTDPHTFTLSLMKRIGSLLPIKQSTSIR